MPWNDNTQQGRYEVIWRGEAERELHDAVERRAVQARLSVGAYIKRLAEQDALGQQNDFLLAAEHGMSSTTMTALVERIAALERQIGAMNYNAAEPPTPPQVIEDAPPSVPPPQQAAAVDSYLDQLGF